MADIIKELNDTEVSEVSGGGANGTTYVSGGMTYYTIVRGDTLSEVAWKYGTTVAKIQALNPGKIKNPDLIRAGDVIRIR